MLTTGTLRKGFFQTTRAQFVSPPAPGGTYTHTFEALGFAGKHLLPVCKLNLVYTEMLNVDIGTIGKAHTPHLP